MKKMYMLAIHNIRCTVHANALGEVISAEGQLPTTQYQIITSIPFIEHIGGAVTVGIRFRVFKKLDWMTVEYCTMLAEKMKDFARDDYPIELPKQGDKDDD